MKGRKLLCTAGFVVAWLVALELAQARERVKCSETQVNDEYHSYQVNGKKCWAKGKPGKYDPVTDLYWEIPVPNVIWQEEHRWVDPSGQTHKE